MTEQEQRIVMPLPAVLKPQDRLSLEMAVVDDDTEEAGRLIKDYGLEISNGSTPLGLCKDWLAAIKKTEKDHHCQNIIDLHSQGKLIAGT